MNLKKKIVFLLLVSLIILNCTPVFAASTGYRSPTPTSTTVYRSNTWSPSVNWDFRNIGIPSNAKVTGMYVRWMVNGYYLHLNLAVFNQSGNGYYIPFNDFRFDSFNGQTAAQIWSSKFWVDRIIAPSTSVKVTPQLCIYYE